MNVYEIVTSKVIESLKAGTAPWRVPWQAGDQAPRNMDGRRYTGINVFMLNLSRLEFGYASPFWLTYKAAERLGGNVRKGEKGHLVVFFKRLEVKDKNARDGEVSTKDKTVPMLRYYKVFNVEQCDGIDAPEVTDARHVDHDPITEAESIMQGYLYDGPSLTEHGNRAFYRPSEDSVTVPPRATHETVERFYSTVFHELGHSTGHESRLNRDIGHEFGSHPYGREELVAEMTAAFLSAEAGIVDVTLDQSASYLDSWIRTIKQDTRAVVVAAGKAQKAADLILGRQGAETHERQLQAA